MKKFLVTQRRTRTVIEYRTVVVLSSSEHYAVKDSSAAPDPWVIADIKVVDQENNVVEIE